MSPRPHPCLTPEEFAERFPSAARSLWLVAVGVLGAGARERAEDALQEACVIALEKLDQFDARTSFEAWMGSIVRYVALNMGRSRQRRATSPTEPAQLDVYPTRAEVPQADAGLLDEVGELTQDQDAFDDAVQGALLDLKPVARACLLLKVVRGLEYREIAALLGVPEGTAMSHVHRARAALRERLDAHQGALRLAGGEL